MRKPRYKIVPSGTIVISLLVVVSCVTKDKHLIFHHSKLLAMPACGVRFRPLNVLHLTKPARWSMLCEALQGVNPKPKKNLAWHTTCSVLGRHPPELLRCSLPVHFLREKEHYHVFGLLEGGCCRHLIVSAEPLSGGSMRLTERTSLIV